MKVKPTWNCPKRGKTWETKLWLVLVLRLPVWESRASFLAQSQSQLKQNQCNTGLLSTLYWKLLWYKQDFWVCLDNTIAELPWQSKRHRITNWLKRDSFLHWSWNEWSNLNINANIPKIILFSTFLWSVLQNFIRIRILNSHR